MSITITTVTGQEYAIKTASASSYGAWQDGGSFTGLNAGTDYDIITRVKETAGTMPSASSAALDVTTKNLAPAPPAAPTLSAKTDVSITITTVTGQEYAIKTASASSCGAWQDGGSFTGLTAATDYNIITRVKETDDTMPSAQSAALEVTTKKTAPDAPGVPVFVQATLHRIMVEEVAGQEYAIKESSKAMYSAWQDSGTFDNLRVAMDYTIVTRVKETETAMPGRISEQLAASTLAPTVVIGNDDEDGAWHNYYDDVSMFDWFYEAVQYVSENNLMNGTAKTLFSPDTDTTRAMLVTILWRLDGSPTVDTTIVFDDVAGNIWYTQAVAWAAQNNIVSGYDKKTFDPQGAVTREQLAVILYRYAVYKGIPVNESADLAGYNDAADISAWARDAMGWAVAEGLIGGVSKTQLDPPGPATRAQVATILMRFVEAFMRA